jgi:hypothetical protein
MESVAADQEQDFDGLAAHRASTGQLRDADYFASLSKPEIPAEAKHEFVFQKSSELLPALQNVVKEVQCSIGEFFNQHLRCAGRCEQTPSRFGFLVNDREDLSVSRIRYALERAMEVGEGISSYSGSIDDLSANVRALSNQFQLNAQATLIEMGNLKIGQTIPSGALGGFMRLVNQMQGVSRDTALKLDILGSNTANKK